MYIYLLSIQCSKGSRPDQNQVERYKCFANSAQEAVNSFRENKKYIDYRICAVARLVTCNDWK